MDPFAARQADLVATLRADLVASDFTVATVDDLLGPVATAALHREQPLPALRAVGATSTNPLLRSSAPGDPSPRDSSQRGAASTAAVLLQLFVLGGEVSRGALDAALRRTGTSGAQQLGLVEASGHEPHDRVRAVVDLRPYTAVDAGGQVDWWLASDLGETATGAALRTDHVLGVGGASTTLAQVTIRAPRRRTLDLGTGCGIQALHAARHSEVVVATDVSRRALGFAAFNAALAGMAAGRLDLRQGSMLEPATGPGAERFDLVVSNPPFVITPRSGAVPGYEYRDAGRSGDDLVRELVVGVGDVLAPGGVAQLLGNWEHRRGQDWRERVGEWVDAAGLDAWIVQREVQDPAEYAETWLRDGGTTPDRDPVGWAAGYAAWLDDFASRDVEAVGFGLVLLRRPVEGRPTMRRLEEHTGPVRQPLGDHLAAGLHAHEWLERHDDDALAAARLTVAPDVTEERHLTPGAAHPTLVLLRQGDGFGRVVQAGTALAGLVGACDGELTVGQISDAVASLMDAGAGPLRAELLPQVRGLVRDGLLRTV